MNILFAFRRLELSERNVSTGLLPLVFTTFYGLSQSKPEITHDAKCFFLMKI